MAPDDRPTCRNCHVQPMRQGGVECEACARYRQRHGSPRPEYLIQRQIRKNNGQ